ncbi:sn-glycerol-3-phosphate ABC transporter ATP-binding protein UgpC [Bradyrhizobium sp. Gha]|uniref:ABC transporter ATP-binding protein n=1 Tax=Bradyrhizobium sp. Gha TaxID=1855318 RepID=UPI0008E7702D|nr:sn-glycerol-3-phosphate ABC transporter ATP-binding protein UgpC [Bradyrhizobium sp. Gha]SFK10933.1 carbohydrate ABC transporter ATP-binding protein, CUT1 family [Bradyrhizobium sp. Gha]
MASISIRNLVKRYGNFTVIPDLNLEIADHEFVVFVGPSGCGKSTLLRIIAGLEPISSGDLYIGDKRVNGVQPAQRDIAMVFQDYALYPHMKVYDNMSFALELRGTPKAEIDARVKRAAALLHIESYLERKPKELSGGQRQRVAMGRAIVRNPKAFLFDEPLSNLDAKLRGQVRAEIKALSQELKTTMVFVTHDQIEAMTMADRIVVLQSGTIQQYDTPETIYERPTNQFVAGFIGSPAMNFFPVEWRQERAILSQAGRMVPLDGETAARLSRAGNAVLGIRPEHFAVASDSADSIAIDVKLVEPLGSDTLIHFDLAGGSAIARVDPALRPKVGDRINLYPQPGKTHLFDASNGQVLW